MGLNSKQALGYLIYGLVFIGSLVYIWASWYDIPVWRYYPEKNSWKVGTTAGEISMGYYGKFFLVIPIAIIGALIIFAITKKTSIFSGSDTEETVFRFISITSVFIALIYYIGHEGSEYIVEKGGIDAVLHAIIWAIVIFVLLIVMRIVTKFATKSVHGEKKTGII